MREMKEIYLIWKVMGKLALIVGSVEGGFQIVPSIEFHKL